jgi:hypothetical protein
MRLLTTAMILLAGLCLATGCKSAGDKADATAATVDVCPKCPGVQTMTADGKCSGCGAAVADACSHCPGVQTATADGKCPMCKMAVK